MPLAKGRLHTMKKFLTTLFFAAMLISLMCIGAYADDIKVYIGTDAVDFDENTGVPFFDENDRTMVPLRASMEAFGAKVEWVEATNSAILTKDDTKLTVTIGSKKLVLGDGTVINTDTNPIETGGRIYLPIRAVAEVFGGYVLWNDPLCSVFIMDDEYKNFRDSFTYDGELSKYVDTVVVSASYIGETSKEDFAKKWIAADKEKLETLLKIIATDKQSLNPEHHININFWYPKDDDDNKDYYIANVSSFSFEAIVYNPFEETKINQLNQ